MVQKDELADMEKFQLVPFCHTYSIGHIHLFLSLVLSSSTSLRAASRVITMFPVTSSNGQIVYQQLEETIEHTGVPKEIISDHGTDLKKGIEIFCRQHPQTYYRHHRPGWRAAAEHPKR